MCKDHSGRLLSVYSCDLDMDGDFRAGEEDVLDLIYTYGDGSDTYIETVNMLSGEITPVRKLANCDAFLVGIMEAWCYDIYAAPTGKTQSGEYFEAKYRIGTSSAWDKIWTDLPENYVFDLTVEEEKYKKEHPVVEPGEYDLINFEKYTENVIVTVRELCAIDVGTGAINSIHYEVEDGKTITPANLFLCDNGEIGVIDAVGKRLLTYDKQGRINNVYNVRSERTVTSAAVKDGCVYVTFDDGSLYAYRNENEAEYIDGGDPGYVRVTLGEEGGLFAAKAIGDGFAELYKYNNGKFEKYTPSADKGTLYMIAILTNGNYQPKTVTEEYDPGQGYIPTGVLNGAYVYANTASDGTDRIIRIAAGGKKQCDIVIPYEKGMVAENGILTANGKIYVLICRKYNAILVEITEREETDTITDETEPVNTDENTQPAETSAPYDHTEFMTRGGLTYTEDGVEEFLTALRSSGLSYNTEREFMCRQVTPEGFYEKVGVKLFTV
ncbi:MAG: hypothetical protein II135_07155, partial [Clostridia bacterium]|nr:hypothetical protein [Clostridia bacterium]